ncbi:hypothetical protein DFJ74DRAFT_714087 [Hyaloraphidium curvatum]|nr:hypothetical protein DFJ74DRAFT_714087 [Hyaloraphidium curvatum]
MAPPPEQSDRMDVDDHSDDDVVFLSEFAPVRFAPSSAHISPQDTHTLAIGAFTVNVKPHQTLSTEEVALRTDRIKTYTDSVLWARDLVFIQEPLGDAATLAGRMLRMPVDAQLWRSHAAPGPFYAITAPSSPPAPAQTVRARGRHRGRAVPEPREKQVRAATPEHLKLDPDTLRSTIINEMKTGLIQTLITMLRETGYTVPEAESFAIQYLKKLHNTTYQTHAQLRNLDSKRFYCGHRGDTPEACKSTISSEMRGAGFDTCHSANKALMDRTMITNMIISLEDARRLIPNAVARYVDRDEAVCSVRNVPKADGKGKGKKAAERAGSSSD